MFFKDQEKRVEVAKKIADLPTLFQNKGDIGNKTIIF